MLTFRVELLSGCYVATRFNDRQEAEWPPHPARIFSALVAAYAEHEPDSPEGVEERRALEWLETQDAPAIEADVLDSSVGHRTVATVFVPVNDPSVVAQPDRQRDELREALAERETATGKDLVKAEKAVGKARDALAKRTKAAVEPARTLSPDVLKKGMSILPEARKKQARTFPSVSPPTPVVRLRWAVTLPEELRVPLLRLVARVSRVGHSSSFVALSLVDDVEPFDRERLYRPDPDGDLMLRWVSRGQTERLCAYHRDHQQVEPRVMPALFATYSSDQGNREEVEVAHTVFDPRWIVLARSSEGSNCGRLPITSVVGIARQLNRALQGATVDPVPELLSGHRADGSPSESPHVAIAPLPFVGAAHADGSLMGVAVILPRGVSESARADVLRRLAALEKREREARAARGEEATDVAEVRLHLGATGDLVLARSSWERPRQANLRERTWSRAAHEWITATPVALDVNPGDLHHPDPGKRIHAFEVAEDSIATAAERIGLPRPRRVEVSRSTLLQGAAKPRTYPRYPVAKDRPQRVLVHARLLFAEPVSGPMLLGAGRYLGLGLCRPIVSRESVVGEPHE
jgi:CRISPR-associated protein Csb2